MYLCHSVFKLFLWLACYVRQDYLSHWMVHACLTTCADSDLLRQVKDWELAWVACFLRAVESPEIRQKQLEYTACNHVTCKSKCMVQRDRAVFMAAFTFIRVFSTVYTVAVICPAEHMLLDHAGCTCLYPLCIGFSQTYSFHVMCV